MDTLYIVIVGSAVNSGSDEEKNEATPGQTPNAEDLKDANILAIKNGFQIHLTLIDPAYHHNQQKADIERINGYSDGLYQLVGTVSQRWEPEPDVRKGDLATIFISYTGVSGADELMSICHSTYAPNRWFTTFPGDAPRPSLADVVIEYCQIAKRGNNPRSPRSIESLKKKDSIYFRPQYDTYSASLLPEIFSFEDFNAVKRRYTDLCALIKIYLKAGFHQGRTELDDLKETWALQVETPVIADMLRYFEVTFPTADMTPHDAILHDGDFRQLLTTTIISCVSNFALNNGLIKKSQIKALGGFHATELWTCIQNVIEKW